MQTIKEQIMDIIRDPSKTHRQTVFALAELADRLCDYPAGIPENFQRLADEEILCDHNDGHAPLCPRYILPDYERFMEMCIRDSIRPVPARGSLAHTRSTAWPRRP